MYMLIWLPGRMVDSDSEYDSEMDDFIDDADENLDYSRHIKEIFGYDKSKYVVSFVLTLFNFIASS